MTKAELVIKNHVQDVGYRLFVMERILESNLHGGAVNLADGTVRVLLEGRKEDIIAFIGRLKKEFPELAENPILLGPKFDESLVIPEEMKLSQALQLNQFSKAVLYLEKMSKEIKDGFNKLPKEITQTLEQKLDKIDKNFEKLPNDLTLSLGEKLDKIDRNLEKLPREIAKAIKES